MVSEPAGNPSDSHTGKEAAEYNPLFDSLVSQTGQDGRLAGYIAYVLYKIAKREWVQRFYESHGRHPAESEMRSYISTWTPSMIENVRSEASQVMTAYAAYVVDKSRPQIREDALRDRSFFRDALVAFCGAFIYSLVLILAAVVLHFFGVDLVEVSKNLAPK